MAKGYIYIMTNPCLTGMVKIGYATDVEARRQQLSTTALPYEYEIYATYETSGKLEDKKLHKLIDNLNPDLRVSKNREFFVMTPQDAYDLLESIATISGSQDKLVKVAQEELVAQVALVLMLHYLEMVLTVATVEKVAKVVTVAQVATVAKR